MPGRGARRAHDGLNRDAEVFVKIAGRRAGTEIFHADEIILRREYRVPALTQCSLYADPGCLTENRGAIAGFLLCEKFKAWHRDNRGLDVILGEFVSRRDRERNL